MKISVAIFVLLFSAPALAVGNEFNDSFNRTKKVLETQIYWDHRITFYCLAAFDDEKRVVALDGFTTQHHLKRAGVVEWEHIVPTENFGRTFAEWRVGSPECVDGKGKTFKGRHCAEKASAEYRFMQADMYNLVPAIGAVNAARRNYNFALLPGVGNAFGSCPMKIEGDKAEPPEYSRGSIARTYKYMEATYPRYHMGVAQRRLMDAWDKNHPVDRWECVRARRIEVVQGNVNGVVSKQCAEKGLRESVHLPPPAPL